MDIPWTYFGLLLAAGMLNDSARIVTRLQDSGVGVISLPVWALSGGGRALLSLLCTGGFLSMLAAFIYGFFITRWYLVLALTFAALVLSVALIYVRLAPRHPVLRLFYGYVLAVVAVFFHFFHPIQ